MTRIMVFGTFDMLHEGHKDMFHQARSLASDPYLIVSVARDSATLRIKGVAPRHTEIQRLNIVRKSDLVNEAILGDESGFIGHIIKANPDILALGYDQEGEYVDGLEELLTDAGLAVTIVRLKAYRPDVFKTSKLL